MRRHNFFRITQNLLLASALVSSIGIVNAETEEDWGRRALKLQANLDMDAPLAQSLWVGTHNSYANPNDDSMMDYNQKHSLKSQLRRGVRELVFDVHWNNDQMVVCHNNESEDCIDGSTGRRKLSHTLDDIKQWINEDEANRNQVVLVKLELSNKARNNINKVQNKIENNIGSYVYRTEYAPNYGDKNKDTNCTSLPADTLTKRAVLARHKNIVIYNSHGCISDGGFNNLSFYQSPPDDNSLTGMENVHSIDTLKSWSDEKQSKVMSRAKDAMTVYQILSEDDEVKIKPGNVFEWMRAGLNVFEMYGYDTGASEWRRGGDSPVQAEDIVWSWQPYYPTTNTESNCGLYNSETERVIDSKCEQTHVVACWNSSDQSWLVSDTSGQWTEAEAICKAEGNPFQFRMPTDIRQLDALKDKVTAVDGNPDVWLNYSDRVHEGEWIANRTLAQLAQHDWSATAVRGGYNGTAYDDKNQLAYDLYRFKRYITRINMSAGNRVDKVGFEYSNGDTTSYGGNGYDRHLDLVSGEHIIKADVCTGSYNDSWRVFYLEFTTDQGHSLNGGNKTDYCQTFSADNGKEFFGMLGWYGNELDAVGFYQRSIN